jgi:hypothetical protein
MKAEASMAERLGNVLFWAGAVLSSIGCVLAWGISSGGSAWPDRAILFAAASIPALIGWAARYVLSGR